VKISTYLTYLGITLIIAGIALTIASTTLNLTNVEGFVGASCVVIFFIPICFTTQSETLANATAYIAIALFTILFAVTIYIILKSVRTYEKLTP